MLCEYGANDIFIDVTDLVLKNFQTDEGLFFPHGNKNFKQYFGDPCPGIVKLLRLHTDSNEVIIIKENDSKKYIYEYKPLNILTQMKEFII